MTSASQNKPPSDVPGRQFPCTWELFFAAAVFAGPALLFWHLHGLWNPNGAYAYGWAVPLLAAFLCKSRWDDRPPRSVPMGSAGFLAVVFALLTLPSRWLQEAAPERSLCVWWYAGACVGVALSLILLAGGTAWFQWFGFPFLFVLTAVPWPHFVEVLVTNSLMHGTARVTVEILCLVGIPSAQAGNLVHIENGVLDIEEACSGIRSLQAMVMMSLFLGELFRLAPAKRILLTVMGLAVTLLANIVRTIVLSWIGFGHGMTAVDRYHDAAGFAVLIFSLLVTLFAAFKLRSVKTQPPASSLFPIGAFIFPKKLTFTLLALFFFGETAVETWYRMHERQWQGWSWSIQWPQHLEDLRFIGIPPRSLQLLMCDESHAATWKEPDGSVWSIYWIRWNPGNPASEVAKVHRPDVCLNAEGAVMEQDLGTHLTSVGGLQLPFHSYIFRMNEKPLYVFFCLYEETPGGALDPSIPRFEETDMFQRALQGRRHVGQQSLEIAISGSLSSKAAQQAFQSRLGQLMQIRQNAAAPTAGD